MRRVRPRGLSPKHDRLWTGSILCRSLVGKHSWCEISGTMAMPLGADRASQCSLSSSGSFCCLSGCRSYHVFSTLGGSVLHLAAFFEKNWNLHSCLSYPHLTATFITDAPPRNLRTWSFVMLIYRQINCLMTARLFGGTLFRNFASSISSPPRVGEATSTLLFPCLTIISILTKML